MRDGASVDELDALVALRAAGKAVEEPLAAAEQDGHDHQVQFVDQPWAEVLLDGGSTTADPDVSSVGGLERSLERLLDPAVDEVERGPALHRDRGTGGGG